MKIDAHQHFWQLARGDYGWLTPDLAPIYRDFGPSDLAPLLAEADIAGTLLVQAAPTAAETGYLLEIAARTDFVRGVVGWVDFEAEDAAATIARLAENPLLVGLRPMLHDIADPGWILRPRLEPAIAAMEEAGLVFDALVRPMQLAPLKLFAQRHPGLAIVIDHGAKPDIAAGIFEPWRTDMAALARMPQVCCKLSGLVTEAGAQWNAARLHPVMQYLLDCFGTERLIFASDWPVCLLAAGYRQWHDIAKAFLGRLPEGERAAIFGGNARRVYLAGRARRKEA